MQNNFLSHDMTPVDPLLHNYGPRRALTTSTLERPLRPLRTGPRPEALAIQDRPSEPSILFNSAGRPSARDHFHQMNMDGRDRPVQSAYAAPRAATEPPKHGAITEGLSSLFYGVKSSQVQSAPTNYGFQKLDLHDELSPSRRAYLERARRELVRFEEKQRKEIEDKKRMESDERKQSTGWLLSKEYSDAAQRNDLTGEGRITHEISEPFHLEKSRWSENIQPRHRHHLEELPEPSEQDRAYLSELANMAIEQRRERARMDEVGKRAPSMTIDQVVQDHRVSPKPRIPREITARDPIDLEQLGTELKTARREQAPKYSGELGQMVQARDGQEHPVLQHVHVEREDKSPEKVNKVTDDGKLSGFYHQITKEFVPLGDRLGKTKGSNRVPKQETEEDIRRSNMQEERRALLDELKRERQELQKRLKDEESRLTDMENKSSFMLTKLGTQQRTDGKISVRKDDSTDPEAQKLREQNRKKFRETLEQDRNANEELRKNDILRSAQEEKKLLESDPWGWNHDMVERQTHTAVYDSSIHPNYSRVDAQDAKRYHTDLEYLAGEQSRRRQRESQERIRNENEHLDNSFDVKIAREHENFKHREHKLRSIQRDLLDSKVEYHQTKLPNFQNDFYMRDPEGDPERPKKDHIKSLVKSSDK